MQRQIGRRKGRLGLACLALTLGVLLLSGPALAVDKYWIGGTGWWTVTGNWSPSVLPANQDNVFLTQSSTTNKTVYYKNTAASGPFLNNLTIDATGAGTMTLNQGYGGLPYPLMSQNEYVGYSGKGTHLQSLGNNTTTNLYLGFNPGSNGAYTLSGTGLLQANNIYVGNTFASTGTFTQSGGTVGTQNLTIGGGPATNGTYNLSGGTLWGGPTVNLNTGGTFNQTGGTLFAPTFNQNGGTVTGTLTNEGTFNYNSGTFTGRLVNYDTANFNANFTAGNGVENQATINVPYVNNTVWRRLEFNGAGLNNSGAFNMTYGALAGSGPAVNNAWMSLNNVEIQSLFTNNGIFQVLNNTSLQATGTNINNGEIRLVFNSAAMPNQPMPLAELHLGLPEDGAILGNNGFINLNGNIIDGGGTLNNLGAGIIYGNGYISSDFVNSGALNMAGGVLNVSKAFTNTGTINLYGTLFGGTITNSGTIEGGSNGATVGNNIINHGMFGVGGGGKVTMTGALSNATDGLITVRTDSKLTINQGLAQNQGVIFNSGYFDNNGHTLANSGRIENHGYFSTGGLTNNSGGVIYFTNGSSTVSGDVTNNSGGNIVVEYDPTVFTGNFTNNTGGTFKVTQTHFTCLGTYTNSGTYISDPAINTFTDLIETADGVLVGGTVNGEQDQFLISNDFINQSQQNKLWNTVAAYLAFTTGTDTKHQFYLPGTDIGGSRRGLENNFAWGTLDISGQQVYLQDGNTATPGGAQYVGLLLGAMLSGDQVTNIFGADGLDIYYDPLLAGNTYLHGGTYGLMGGGLLAPVTQIPLTAPVPLPPTVWMVLSGLAGLGILRRRKVHQG